MITFGVTAINPPEKRGQMIMKRTEPCKGETGGREPVSLLVSKLPIFQFHTSKVPCSNDQIPPSLGFWAVRVIKEQLPRRGPL